MTYSEIKTALKSFQAQGHPVPALNSKREILENDLAQLQAMTTAQTIEGTTEVSIEEITPSPVAIAPIAGESEELLSELVQQAKERQRLAGGDKKSESQQESVVQIFEQPIEETPLIEIEEPDPMATRTISKIAAALGTNRQYVTELAQQAKERQRLTGEKFGRGQEKVVQIFEQPIEETDPNKNRTTAKIADALGTNRQYVTELAKANGLVPQLIGEQEIEETTPAPKRIRPEHPAITELRGWARLTEVALIWAIALVRSLIRFSTPHLIRLCHSPHWSRAGGVALRGAIVASVLIEVWLIPKLQLLAYLGVVWILSLTVRLIRHRRGEAIA